MILTADKEKLYKKTLNLGFDEWEKELDNFVAEAMKDKELTELGSLSPLDMYCTRCKSDRKWDIALKLKNIDKIIGSGVVCEKCYNSNGETEDNFDVEFKEIKVKDES
jgi:hypothetical protein